MLSVISPYMRSSSRCRLAPATCDTCGGRGRAMAMSVTLSSLHGGDMPVVMNVCTSIRAANKGATYTPSPYRASAGRGARGAWRVARTIPVNSLKSRFPSPSVSDATCAQRRSARAPEAGGDRHVFLSSACLSLSPGCGWSGVGCARRALVDAPPSARPPPSTGGESKGSKGRSGAHASLSRSLARSLSRSLALLSLSLSLSLSLTHTHTHTGAGAGAAGRGGAGAPARR